MATNPPITIGPFTNVPAPGSGVKSDWAQQITNYVNPGAWVAFPFTAPWVGFSASSYQPLRYRKEGSIVRVSGAMNGGTSGTACGTLPAGFRPTSVLEFPALGGVTNTLPITIVVNPTGICNYYGPNGLAYVTINFTFGTT